MQFQKKSILFFTLCFYLTCSLGQTKNELHVELGRQFATTGDLKGSLLQGNYRRIIFKKFTIGLAYSQFHASDEDFPFYETDTSTAIYTINLNSQAGLPSQYPTTYDSYRLWKVRPEHTDQLNWKNLRVTLGYKAGCFKRFVLHPEVGIGFGYIERNFIVLREAVGIVSYFSSVPRRGVTVTSLYVRGVDVHFNTSLNLRYKINPHISLSASYLIDMYKVTGDWNRGWTVGAVSSF